MKAYNLKIEYLTNPIGVDILMPRFSWVLEGGKKQTAYRIVANDDNGELLWDSGKVESDQMHLIPWGGNTLTSRTCVEWSVTVWDENSAAEESDKATFEIGLLNENDWKAKWITGDYAIEKKKI